MAILGVILQSMANEKCVSDAHKLVNKPRNTPMSPVHEQKHTGGFVLTMKRQLCLSVSEPLAVPSFPPFWSPQFTAFETRAAKDFRTFGVQISSKGPKHFFAIPLFWVISQIPAHL